MRLHLVDGTWELFRAHFSKRPSAQAEGRDVKATLGVLDSLAALLTDPAEAATHVAVAFDHPIRSFRNDLFAGYKTDAGVPEELLAQFDLVEEAVAALGMVVWPMDRHECDDALASAARRFAPEVEQVRVCTPDKDLGQVVGGNVVQVDRLNAREYDADGVRARLGVAPESVPDLLALVGDDADGIPGLAGWGSKGAAGVLGRWPHLEAIPLDAPGTWGVRGAERLAATLRAGWDDALLYRTLATLVTDVPIREDLADLRWSGPRAGFGPLCDRLGARRLRARVEAITPGGSPAARSSRP